MNYLDLIDKGNSDCPISMQCIPSEDEMSTKTTVSPTRLAIICIRRDPDCYTDIQIACW